MRPPSLLAFLLAVFLLLGSLQYFIPPDAEWAGIPIRVFRWEHLLDKSAKEPDPAIGRKLEILQEKADQLGKSDSLDTQAHLYEAATEPGDEGMPELNFHIDSASGIQFPSGDSSLLARFFQEADSARARGQLIRILHIGDSQIEGDRITGYLRQRFQQLYGGCGPGWIPFFEEEPTRFAVESFANRPAERFFLFGKPRLIGHGKYSLLHTLVRIPKDSGNTQRSFKATFRLRPVSYKRSSYFEQASVLFRNPESSLVLSSGSFSKGQKPLEFRYSASDSLRIARMEGDEKYKALTLEVKEGQHAEFLGLCLDGKAGIAVDNIPLRGSSGLEMFKIQPRFLQDQIKRMGVKMVILQFGVNLVPYESKGYEWYESALVKLIRMLKNADPNVCVLVVGVSDMAKKQDGQWRSYPNIGTIKQAQIQACAQAGAAFWDLHAVMGGENSILAWAAADPPLAGKDYIHMTPKGAQVVGEFLFQALASVKYKRLPKKASFP